MTTSVWLARLGLNRAVSVTLMGRAWGVVVGVITIVFIGHFLTPVAQGYYYTFASLIALQVFVELGLTYAIAQFASHEMAHLTWRGDGTVDGSPTNKKRLQSLLQFAMRWFGGAGLVMSAVLVPLGAAVAGLDPSASLSRQDVFAPWTLLVLLSAANLPVMAAAALLEGCGQIAEVAFLRLAQAVVAAAAMWCVLAMGGSLFALAAQAAATLLTGVLWLAFAYRPFFRDLLSYRADTPGMSWPREIWPFHWRIAVSWASGYLIAQLLSPMLFASQGPVAAGQMGLALQVSGALNVMALAWINTKTPVYGQLIARGQGRELDRLFFRGLAQSSFALGVCLLGVLAVLWGLEEAGSPWAQRVLPLPLMTAMAALTMANHVVFAQAAVLRAHKQEPFMVLSVVSGLATAGAASILIPAWGLDGAVAAYALGAGVVGLSGGTAIFLHKRKIWWLRDAR